MNEYKIIDEENLDEAFGLCYDTFTSQTEVFSQDFNDIDDLVAKKLFIIVAKDYHKEHNTTILGCYRNSILLGVIEMNNSYINILAVKEDYQQLGIGHNLFLKSIINKNIGETIYVNADKNAIGAYKSWGFSSIESEDKKTCKMVYIISEDNKKQNVCVKSYDIIS